MDVRGRRITVMGLGRHGGGVAAVQYLAAQGALVTVTDLADAHALRDSLEALSGLPLADVIVGEHREQDFGGADVVVVNPAVRPDHPLLRLAIDSGAELTSEVGLFAAACPARLVGVTGSNGKSTTAAMIAAILKADGRHTWLGGNIGGSLLLDLPRMSSADWVVLELSSFQLARWSDNARFPEVAIVTNCTPNHLDWHGNFEDYAQAKQRLLLGQDADSLAVLNRNCPQVSKWSSLVRGRLLENITFDQIPQLAVPGEHNRQNAQLAATAARGVGCREESIAAALGAFHTLPHRLEFLAEVAGRSFYNDSQATTPESAIAALRSFTCPVWLLAGGYDKGCNLEPLAVEIANRARGAAFFGAVREKLWNLVTTVAPSGDFANYTTLREAFAWSFQHSRAGDAIVLSPACASFDQFRDYAERAECFQQLVHECAARAKIEEQNLASRD